MTEQQKKNLLRAIDEGERRDMKSGYQMYDADTHQLARAMIRAATSLQLLSHAMAHELPDYYSRAAIEYIANVPLGDDWDRRIDRNEKWHLPPNYRMYWRARQLRRGNVLLVHDLTKHIHTGKVFKEMVLDRFVCRVGSVSVDERTVSLTYTPTLRGSYRVRGEQITTVDCGFGCHFIRPGDGPQQRRGKWGWQSIEVVGHEGPLNDSPINLYRNPGYDLVNM